jgi:hypothetical protein
MQDAPKERWEMPRMLAANEQDPEKPLSLVQEINNPLKGKQSLPTDANSAGFQIPPARSQNSCLGVQEVPYGKSHFQE